ncbi:hypothetical protein ACJX0J_020869, partial [Zea mays]
VNHQATQMNVWTLFFVFLAQPDIAIPTTLDEDNDLNHHPNMGLNNISQVLNYLYEIAHSLLIEFRKHVCMPDMILRVTHLWEIYFFATQTFTGI